jgi:hypothetical protein
LSKGKAIEDQSLYCARQLILFVCSQKKNEMKWASQRLSRTFKKDVIILSPLGDKNKKDETGNAHLPDKRDTI